MRRLLPLFAFGALVVFQALPVHAADGDGDNVDDAVDVCPSVSDPFQGDHDGNGVGDLCEPDAVGGTSFEGTAANELIIGTTGDDTLSGAGGADAIYGLEGDDTLDGGAGNDSISGGPGADTLTGGSGCDVFATNPVGDEDVITDFNPATDRMAFPASSEDDATDPLAGATFGGDDHLVVTFGEGDESGTLEFEGLPAGVQIVISSGPCITPPDETPPPEEPEEPPFECSPIFGEVVIPEILPLDGLEVYGTEGADTLDGTNCSDLMIGDAPLPDFTSEDLEDLEEQVCPVSVCADDVINGLAGNDLIIGDKLVLLELETGGNDTIHGDEGLDIILGDAAIIVGCLCGGVGDVGAGELEGTVAGDDELYGDEGTDVIFGDALAMIGNTYGGDDEINGGDDDDILVGDAFVMIGGSIGGDDDLHGGDGDDIIYGDAVLGIDLDSVAGEDFLNGGAGDDFLVGDAEIVDGEAAEDTFFYDASSDFGDDIIADAGKREVSDTIRFIGTGFSDVAGLDTISTLVDDGTDVVATVFTDTGKGTKVGSITMWGLGFAAGATTWAALDGFPTINIEVSP